MIILIIGALTLVALWAKHAGYAWMGIDKVGASTIMLVGAFAMFAFLLWKMQRDRGTSYDMLDMLTEQGRASLDKHITAVMAVLAVWWIITQTQAGKDVSERMIEVLMIFVVYRGAKEAINAYKITRPDPQLPQNDTIEQQVIVTPAAREAPDVPAPKMAARKQTPAATRTAGGKTITPRRME